MQEQKPITRADAALIAEGLSLDCSPIMERELTKRELKIVMAEWGRDFGAHIASLAYARLFTDHLHTPVEKVYAVAVKILIEFKNRLPADKFDNREKKIWFKAAKKGLDGWLIAESAKLKMPERMSKHAEP